MDTGRHRRLQRPTSILSAAMLWLAAVMSAVGGQGVPAFDLPGSAQSASAQNSARSGAVPAQRSTAQSTSLRFVLASEHALEAASVSGFDGHDPALAPAIALALPVSLSADGETLALAATSPASTTGFRARAPPILA